MPGREEYTTMNATEIQRQGEVWPVMLTPFTESGEVDYLSLERLVEWYEENGATGLFAACQSSEVFYLSLSERIKITETVCKKAHIPVITSGHIAYGIEDQKEELKRLAETGVEALVLITNRMAEQGEDENVWMANLEKLMDALPKSMPLGFYECPYPYKRLLSDEEISFCAQTGRFHFLKDTCCDLARIQKRVQLLENTSLRLYNANTATLLESLRSGCSGFSGIMANFHPKLYTWLCKNWKQYPEKAEELQAFLTLASYIENRLYPVNAKYFLMKQGILSSDYCRVQSHKELTPLICDEVRQLKVASEKMEKIFLC